ncbi:CIA30 family protein [Neptunicella sp.]|uniref:CIA30 family protein n=1 Tax=Neptunicella sp. TaxID=2125986 RepID=UPI003F68F051
MKTLYKVALHSVKTMLLTSMLAFSTGALSASLPTLVDDFSNATDNNLGLPRQLMSDTVAGGNTSSEVDIAAGVMRLKGDIVPPRGQPGWASSILPLGNMGEPEDASQYKGIQLLIKIHSGNLSISANSTEVDNFDYHSAPISVPSDGTFHQVKIPFESMKRGWSEQTHLNPATLNSLSIIAYAMQPAPFDFEIDEVRFY